MNMQRTKISQTQQVATYIDSAATLSEKKPAIASKINRLSRTIDPPISTLNAYKADVTLYLALENEQCSPED